MAGPKKSLIVPAAPVRDISAIAHREGFEACTVRIVESVWERIEAREGSAGEWLALVFETLRRGLLAAKGDASADAFRMLVVHNEPTTATSPGPRAVMKAFAALKSGARGFFDGSVAVLDVPRRDGEHEPVVFWVNEQRPGGLLLTLFFRRNLAYGG